MNGVGLLSTMPGIAATVLFDVRGRSLLDAGLTGNYVIQQMVARGIEPRHWTNGGRTEVDLIVEDGSSKAVPVEIKSTENVRSKSLGVHSDRYMPDRVIRVSARNFWTGEVKGIPLHVVGCLADELAMRHGRGEMWGIDADETENPLQPGHVRPCTRRSRRGSLSCFSREACEARESTEGRWHRA